MSEVEPDSTRPPPGLAPRAPDAADPGHIPVLLGSILRLLDPRPGETFLDCTAGRGGHAAALAERVGSSGTVIGVDLDADNLAFARERVERLGLARFVPLHGSFADAPQRMVEAGLAADVVLADLGFASVHVDEPARGFSFNAEGPLDMRYDRSRGRTAAELLAALSERELTELLRRVGEEPLAPKIARKIAHARRIGPIDTTLRLAGLVEEVYGPRARRSRLHPATRTFMALRIAVNDELNALGSFLQRIVEAAEAIARDGSGGWLRPGARIAIVSFHSLEDRLVKHAFAGLSDRGLAVRLVRRPVVPDDAELAANPRARPSKLRAVALGPTPGPSATPRGGWDTGRRARRAGRQGRDGRAATDGTADG